MLFHFLTCQQLVSCLQRRLDVPVTLTNWMNEARIFESSKEAPAGRLAGIIVSACALLASVKERVVDKSNMTGCISALLSIDEALERWVKSLTAEYGYKTSTVPGNYADVFLERHDSYPGIEITHTWNLQRCTRALLFAKHLLRSSRYTSAYRLLSQHCPPFLTEDFSKLQTLSYSRTQAIYATASHILSTTAINQAAQVI
jgi:hypothetical protein